MLKTLLNELRRNNGRHPVEMNNWNEDRYCLWHCFHMSKSKELCHTPEYLLNGKAEAVAVRTFYRDVNETLRQIVFEQIANSPEHRDIILYHDNFACAFCVDDYHIFVTIRGW
jgi:hypothetical protein